MSQAWFVRSGRDDEFEDVSFAQGVVVIGWQQVGDLSGCADMSMIASRVAAAYPGVSHPTLNSYTIQLHVFRHLMQVDDIVVLLRGKTPDIGVGRITGDYTYLPDGPAGHCRTVKWVHRQLRRSEFPELADPPALSVVYRVSRGVARLQELLGGPTQEKPETPAHENNENSETSGLVTSAAYENLSRNLNYARNLTAAGSHLEQLKVSLFEVTDVYRAAWVQAVAALDHWVHQEIYDRMYALSQDPARTRPAGYGRFGLPMSVVEEIHKGQTALPDALGQAVRSSLAYKTYQSPDKIKEGLGYVADVADLWSRVAKVLNEQDPSGKRVSGKVVESRLREIVQRRNKIAHEYDEDPRNPPHKQGIDVGMTMATIGWLDRLALALLVVLDQE